MIFIKIKFKEVEVTPPEMKKTGQPQGATVGMLPT